MIIRQETSEDHEQLNEFIKEAFKTAKVSDGREQEFVDKLRCSGKYIPELALVAEQVDGIIGQILLTKMNIETRNGPVETLLLGPLSSKQEQRNRGLGARLIKESFRRARDMEFKSAVLVGDPGYYRRFGFIEAIEFGLQNTNGIPHEYVLACELEPGALEGLSGTLTFETADTVGDDAV